MCGILGLIGGTPALRARFQSALDLIAHRGPDGEDTWSSSQAVLGHRRLAIIDTSSAGAQPMADPETGALITYNGEIYNYLELRRQLEGEGVRFRTHSDTEVLLKAYLHWGERCVEKLNGMWAFAIWEPKHRTLFASRDRFGVKPFYYAHEEELFAFGSEPKALIRLKPELAEPNPAQVRDLVLRSRTFAGADTFFARIHSLPPAHNLVLGPDGKLSIRRYWDYPTVEAAQSDGNADVMFAELFEDAVRLRLRSDVPLGLTLSGGVDSTAVLSAMARNGAPEIVAYTAVFGPNERGEEAWAKSAANICGAELRPVNAPADEWLSTLKRIIWHMDAPGYSTPVFPLWEIMKRARERGTIVLLEGQGADELLGGYPQYFPLAMADPRTLFNPGQLATGLRGGVRTFGARLMLAWALRLLSGPLYGTLQRRVGRGRLFADTMPAQEMDGASGGNDRALLFAALQRDHSADVLPSLLQYGDAVSMAHGIESRLPFMDYRLVEWVFRSQPRLIRDGWTKAPVRNYLDANGYGKIARRTDKLGFGTPTDRWTADNAAELRSMLLDYPNSRLWEFFDRKRASRFIADGLNGDRNPHHLYKFVAANIWLDNLSEMASWKDEPTRRAAAFA